MQSIASQIHIALTEEQKTRLANPRQTRPEAYEAYLKGRYYWNKRTADGMQKAEHYFQQAIDSDPTYAAAYSGLADCNSGLAWHGFKSPADALPKAYAAARKAVEIDPQSAEAHASLGLVLAIVGIGPEPRPSSGVLWSWILNMQMRTTGTETIFPLRAAMTRRLPKPAVHWNSIHLIS